MIALRWFAIVWAGIWFAGFSIVPYGWPSTVLLAALIALVLFICWTFGAFADSDPNSRKEP